MLKKQQEAWFAAMNRKDMEKLNISNLRVRSRHFITGKPAGFKEDNHPDWRPSLHLGYRKMKLSPSPGTKMRKYERALNRSVVRKELHFEVECLEDSSAPVQVSEAERIRYLEAELLKRDEELCQVREKNAVRVTSLEAELSKQNEELHHLRKENGERTSLLETAILRQARELSSLRQQVLLLSLDLPAFVNNDRKMRFFTGLPNCGVFNLILSYLTLALDEVKVRNFNNFQKLLLCLMKFRHNTSFRGLSYRFGITEKGASITFKKVAVLLDHTFAHMIHWPNRDCLRAVTPQCFIRNFGNRVSVIIDCFEIPIQKPSSLRGKVQTYSDYKSRNTAKFLIGITHHGFISFISRAHGGRISDKQLTETCGILDNLIIPGDVVLADCGFTIYDLVGSRQAQLRIPDFTKGKSQLLPREIENTQNIAEVCIHVERVIGLMHNKFTILQGPIPITLLKATHKSEMLVDCIVRVCGILSNMVEAIVSV